MRNRVFIFTAGTTLLLSLFVLRLGHSTGKMKGDRVADARKVKAKVLEAMCEKTGVPYPPPELFLRAFKSERVLEIWAAPQKGAAMKLLTSYGIAAMSGGLGPKRVEGDKQVPEGFYQIDRYNPASSYLLSMRVNYPNASDRILSDKERPGGDIYIHGNQKSAGCLAMTDDKIQEIYLLALDTKNLSGKNIPIHIFPSRMNGSSVEAIRALPSQVPDWIKLWVQLKKGYDAFEETKRPPKIAVRSNGSYQVTKVAPTAK